MRFGDNPVGLNTGFVTKTIEIAKAEVINICMEATEIQLTAKTAEKED